MGNRRRSPDDQYIAKDTDGPQHSEEGTTVSLRDQADAVSSRHEEQVCEKALPSPPSLPSVSAASTMREFSAKPDESGCCMVPSDQHVDPGLRFGPHLESETVECRWSVVDIPPAYSEH